MMDEIKLDANRLIAEVYKRPALWNHKDVLYHNRDSTNCIWMELSSIFKCPKAVLKSKWKGLRDTFRAELKKEQAHRKSKYPNRNRPVWIHYKNLMFLKEQMLPRPPIWERNDNQNDWVQTKNYDNRNDYNKDNYNDYDNISNLKKLKKSFNIIINRKNLTHTTVNGQILNQEEEETTDNIVKKPIKINFLTPAVNEASTKTIHPVIATPDNKSIEAIVKREPIDIVDNGDYPNNTSDNVNGLNNNENEEKETSANEEMFQAISPEQVPSGNTEESMADGNRLDDNYYFLMSLLPHIRTLPAERRMLLRMQMQELVYKEVYKKNINTDC